MSKALPGRAFAVSSDPSAILKVIFDNWELAFASALPRSVRNYFHELYGNQVARLAALTPPRELKGLGRVALDPFIVSTTTRVPSNGYWPKAGHSSDAWNRVLGRAMLLHGDAKAPWE